MASSTQVRSLWRRSRTPLVVAITVEDQRATAPFKNCKLVAIASSSLPYSVPILTAPSLCSRLVTNSKLFPHCILHLFRHLLHLLLCLLPGKKVSSSNSLFSIASSRSLANFFSSFSKWLLKSSPGFHHSCCGSSRDFILFFPHVIFCLLTWFVSVLFLPSINLINFLPRPRSTRRASIFLHGDWSFGFFLVRSLEIWGAQAPGACRLTMSCTLLAFSFAFVPFQSSPFQSAPLLLVVLWLLSLEIQSSWLTEDRPQQRDCQSLIISNASCR